MRKVDKNLIKCQVVKKKKNKCEGRGKFYVS